jgi:hypothetical protein
MTDILADERFLHFQLKQDIGVPNRLDQVIRTQFQP